MSKKTARIFAGCIAVAIFSAGSARAGLPNGTATVWLGTVLTGQAGPSTLAPADPRMQCDDLLRRSRELMAQNDPAGAESLIVQAERLGVEYPPIYLGDTPKRARRDLDRMRGAAGGSTSLPSQLFSPLGATKKAPPSDPFMGQNRGNLVDPNAANVPPDMQGRYPMPTMGRPDLAASGAPPFGRQDPMAPPAQDDLR